MPDYDSPDAPIEAKVDQQKTALLFRNVSVAQGANVFNAALLALAEMELGAPRPLTILWWVLFTLIAAGRALLARQFAMANPSPAEIPSWRNRFLLGTFLGGLAWSAAIAMFMWHTSESAFMMAAIVIVGTLGGAVPMLASVLRVYRTYALTVGITLIVCVSLQAESLVYWSFAAMSLLFLISMLKSADYFHQTVETSLRRELQQAAFAQSVESARLEAVTALNERLRAEQSLAASEARFRLLASATFEGIGIIENLRYVDANDQLLTMFGYSRDEFIGMDVAKTLPPDRRDAILSNVANGVEAVVELPMVRKDGRTIDVAAHGQTIVSDGRTLRITAFRDLTEQKQARDALIKAEIAESANRSKSSFLANMSHEIRTPMNAIIGMADLALGTDLTPRQHNYLSKIRSASDNLLTIINDILDFSKIEAGKLEMELAPFVLEDVFEQLSSVVAMQAESQGIELHYDIGDDGRLLEGDPMRLGQVLSNLVTNGIKFSTGGSVVVRVRADSEDDSSVVLHFEIADEGIGISPQQLAVLFQPFTQADSSTTRKFGGTGLGLTISKQLVELMGGRIWAESTQGSGSTFHFTARFKSLGRDRRQRLSEISAHLAPQDPRHALVVDDNGVARSVLTLLVSQTGLDVDAFESGTAAIARIGAPTAPDYLVCLIDWHMEGLDGIETIRQLKQAFQCIGKQAPPMLLVTANSHHHDLEPIRHEVDGVLSKPLSARQLHRELTRCLRRSSSAEQPPNERRKGSLRRWSQFRGLDVLVVEDVELNREVIGELLAEVGLTARFAYNGREAIEAVEHKRPDIVLMDVQMPVMDGYTATRRLREMPGGATLPIIALTANALLEEQQRCLAAGMNAHVAKPVRMDTLYDQIAANLPGWQPRGDAFTAAEPAPANIADPLALPGIDLAVGLAHVKKHPLLLRLLAKFRETNGVSFQPDFEQAIAADDWETQIRLAHSMKGISRTLGATDLGEAAEALERTARAKDRAERDAKLAVTLAHLTAVCDGLAHLPPA